jgi:hypothetical protein
MYKQVKDLVKNTIIDNVILRVADNAFIPMNPANTDYQAFLKYKAEGGKVYAANEEVPVNG